MTAVCRRTWFTFLVGSIAACSLLPLVAAAQSFLDVSAPALEITLSPQYPRPGEDVRASITSYTIDTSAATITWFLDNTKVSSGVGQSSFSLKAGGLGKRTTVSAVIETQSTQVSAHAIVQPIAIDILWESQTLVPPFFRGRALPTTNTPITARAEVRAFDVNGKPIDPRDLIFTWNIDGRLVRSLSGRGRATAAFNGPLRYGRQVATVEVSDLSGTILGKSAAILTAREPHTTFYQDYPLLGIAYHQALQETADVSDTETAIVAVPFYINPTGISYEWTLDGKRVDSYSNRPNAISVRSTSENQQEGSLGVFVQSAVDILQRVRASITISLNTPVHFGTQPTEAANTQDPLGLPVQ